MIKVDFSSIPWAQVAQGASVKLFSTEKRRLRIMELTKEFREADWCQNGHSGLILEGSLTIDLGETTITLSEGDGLMIPKGKKHKARALSDSVRLVLFEEHPQDF